MAGYWEETREVEQQQLAARRNKLDETCIHHQQDCGWPLFTSESPTPFPWKQLRSYCFAEEPHWRLTQNSEKLKE